MAEEEKKEEVKQEEDVVQQPTEEKEEIKEEPKEDAKPEPTEEEALDNAKDPKRTGEYIDKLQKENKQYKNVLDSLVPEPTQQPRPQPQPITQAPTADQFKNLEQKDVNEQFKAMVDENGYLDGNKLFAVLSEMDKRTKRAEQQAAAAQQRTQQQGISQDQVQRTAKMEKVHAKYPSLDPENKEGFDPQFYEAVRNDLIGQMMDGKQDPMAAANKWADKFIEMEGVVAKTKEETEVEEKKTTQKEQINVVRPRSASMAGYYEKEEDEALNEQIRKGKKGALAEKLRRMEQK